MTADLESKSSKTLAGIVVAHRLLGFNEELSIKAMEILTTRQDFDYLKYIDDTVKSAPKSKLNMNTSVKSLLHSSGLENIITNILKTNEQR